MAGPLPDLTPFFERYETQAKEADALFAHIRSQYPDLVVCKEKCSSCCHAMFDLSLVEALYLNGKFNERFPPGKERTAILDAADSADRTAARIKRKVFKESKEGKDSNEILAEIARVKVRCPLLDENDRCIMYDVRPVTCRLYGVPTAIGGQSHTCGLTGFLQGEKYPTVALDKIQHRLSALSTELTTFIGTAYTELDSMYVPVSTALLTQYDAAYLGIGGIQKEKD
ncbi:YkgJ family cysteine cluster protein [Desulfovibrio sp. OttesenSCG-928-G15]|nr:YkgJ family cysteine cluster protein [Desulfovibrio sp. OttesenSCG-928-G15]